MAVTTAGAQLTQAHRQAQVVLRADVLADLTRMWTLFRRDGEDLAEVFTRFAAAAEILIRQRHGDSAGLAAAYFERFRLAEGVGGSAAARLAAAPPREVVAESLTVAGRVGVANALRAGKTPAAAAANGLVRVLGTASSLVLGGGRRTLVESVRGDPRARGWQRVTSGSPCAFCAMVASRGPAFKSDRSARFEAHDHCVPAGTLVNGPSVDRGFRRWYEGELVVISLTSGDELAITPNHPVLTVQGWVPAGFLSEGDDVVQRSGADLDSLGVPNENDVPTPIEDVWGAPRMDLLRAVPVAAEDFHGDGVGSEGNVEVVAPNGLFSHVADSALVEPLAEGIRSGACRSAVLDALARERDSGLVFLGVGRPTPRGMGVQGSLPTPHRVTLGEMQRGCVSHGSALDAVLAEPPSYNASRDSMPVRDGLLGLAFEVGIDDPWRACESGPRPSAVRAKFDAPVCQSFLEGRLGYESRGRALAQRLSGGVQLARVRELRRVDFAGHVYNLQTVEGWYDANTVIVSNCSCSAEPFYRGSAALAVNVRLAEAWQAAQREAAAAGDLTRGTSNDALNAFRRHLGNS